MKTVKDISEMLVGLDSKDIASEIERTKIDIVKVLDKDEKLNTISLYKLIALLSAILTISLIITLSHFIGENKLLKGRVENLEISNKSLNDNLNVK